MLMLMCSDSRHAKMPVKTAGLESKGEIIRLECGMLVANPEISDKKLYINLIINYFFVYFLLIQLVVPLQPPDSKKRHLFNEIVF